MNTEMLAKMMMRKGRYGDTMLAHISPEEAEMLEMMGGSGTINPETGLPEFFGLKSLIKGGKKIAGAPFKLGGNIAESVGLPEWVGEAGVAGGLGALAYPYLSSYASGVNPFMGSAITATDATELGLDVSGFGAGALGKALTSPTAKTVGVLGGLGVLNQMGQKASLKDAREQSYEDWEKYAFPSEAEINSSKMRGTADLATQLQLARKRYLEGAASRGVRGGSGQISAGLADIENQGSLTYAKLIRDLEQMRYAPRFAPMQYPSTGGPLDPALSYLALAQGLKLSNEMY